MKQQLHPHVLKKYQAEGTREAIPSFSCKIRDGEDWKSNLPSEVYRIMFADGTEPAFSHPYHELKDQGTYYCRACGQPLFGSEGKFDSGTGWPSFYAPLHPSLLEMEFDFNIGLPRVALACSCCEGHLGHVFLDGPKPSGLRFCLNGNALEFRKD